MLPASITEQERATLLVPTTQGELVPLGNGVYYYRGDLDVDNGKIVAHHLIDEKLAKKIRIQHLGVDEAEDIDLGGKPITLIRNTLMQYDPKQFFTEFIANASDAGAKRFSLLVDDHEGPTTHLLWKGLAAFQNASLIVHNDGVFTRDDFRGILETGIGGKKKRAGVIGHFGLGALSMFHFTEVGSGSANLRKTNIYSLAGHDCFWGSRSFHQPVQAKLIVLRETLASPFFRKHEKVIAA